MYSNLRYIKVLTYFYDCYFYERFILFWDKIVSNEYYSMLMIIAIIFTIQVGIPVLLDLWSNEEEEL
jgi:hypothetical protein